MPPVTKAGGREFRKDVDFVSKDDDEQKAAGIVMVPDKADLQNDFAREDTIRGFADQFKTFTEAGEAGGGIMHAVFPDDWMNLERNEVLDEAEEIGGTEAPAGAWVQEWQYNNDQLWDLVSDGILAGYSIGAVQVDWNGPYEQDEVDDVEVPAELDDDALVWELVDGLIREVSTVDIPAVPDAQILDTKTAGVDKRLGQYLGDPNGFVEEALERGHSESEAERLWDVLSTAVEQEGARDPGEKSVFERVGKAVLDALPGGSNGDPDSLYRSHVSETPDVDPRDGQADKDAAGGDTPADDGDDDDVDATADDDTDSDMSNDNPDDDGGSDVKELAEQNAEQINELTESVKELTESLKGPEPKTAEIEIDGETYEIPESEVKDAFGVDDDADVADAIKDLEDKVDTAHQRIDAVNRQSGGSTQVDAAAAEAQNSDGEGEKGGALDDIGKALS